MLSSNFLLLIISVLIAITIHEAAHALAAYLLGDPTAKKAGRLSLNPLKHLDLYGSLLFLFAGIGWGKPVPTNAQYFKNPKRDSAIVALAGPISNFILAIILAIPLQMQLSSDIENLITYVFTINIILGAFNLIPIPPLDGSKVLAIFLPQRTYYKYQNFIQANLAYLVLLLFADKFLIQDLFGFSIFGKIVELISGLITTIILLGS